MEVYNAIRESIRRNPDRWGADRYYWKNTKDDISVWIANGVFGISVRGVCVGETIPSWRERRAINNLYKRFTRYGIVKLLEGDNAPLDNNK